MLVPAIINARRRCTAILNARYRIGRLEWHNGIVTPISKHARFSREKDIYFLRGTLKILFYIGDGVSQAFSI